MLRHLFSAAVLVLSVTAAAQAETKQMQVFVGDLNLARPAGQAAAQARIHVAAVRLCSSIPDTIELGSSTSFESRRCVARAVEQASAQIASIR